MTKALQALSATIRSFESEVIELQRRLVETPAIGPESGGQGELNKALTVEEMLRDLNFDSITRYDAPDARVPGGLRPNIVAKLNGSDAAPTVWVCTHLDVVPAGNLDAWRTDPFKLAVEGDRVFGRGTEDNHQGLVSVLLAVKALLELNIAPAQTVGLLIVSDEETGSEYGLGHLLRLHADLFHRDDWFIVPDAGDAQGVTIEIAEKSVYWLRFRVLGRQCHASIPEQGINAMRVGAHLIVALEQLAEFFPKRDPLFEPPQCTFEPTKKEANIPNVNTIPGEDVFYMDCRVLPDYSLLQVDQAIAEITGRVARQFGVEIQTEVVQREESAPPTRAEAPVVRALAAALRAIGKEAKIIGIGGGTVAALLRKAGYQAAVWSTLDDVCHQPNEYSRISGTLADATALAVLFAGVYRENIT